MIKLSICIPTYNRAQHLSNCLQSLISMRKPKGFQFEICISDNGSNDNTKEICNELISRQHFKEINLPPSEVLLVGDTNHDGEIANGLKANCLLYTRGHNSEAVLARSGHPLIDDLMQVPARVLD